MAMDLESQISVARRSISSEAYPMSIGELTNLFKSGELIIWPEYQRLFRWTLDQKSKFIESLLLSIPVPSIFVAQRSDGKWELVDGLQRISTILEFQGELVDAAGLRLPQLRLTGTQFLEALDGVTWIGPNSLSEPQRLDFKRARIDVKIIKRESSVLAKYDLFQRLNSLGVKLTASELRVAGIVSASKVFFRWLKGLSDYPSFVGCIKLDRARSDEGFAIELVMRFLVLYGLKNDEVKMNKLKDFPGFVDQGMLSMALRLEKEVGGQGESDLEQQGELILPERLLSAEQVFKETFDILNDQCGDNAFRAWKNDKFKGKFVLTAFEVLALGLGWLISRSLPVSDDILGRMKEFWSSPEFASARRVTGRSTEARLVVLIPLGRDLLGK